MSRHRPLTLVSTIAVSIGMLAAASCSGSSGDVVRVAPAPDGDVETQVEPLNPPILEPFDESPVSEIERIQRLVSRTMPLDGNRLYAGTADLSVEPEIDDAFETSRVVLWDPDDGLDWFALDGPLNGGAWFDGAGTISLRALTAVPPVPVFDSVPDTVWVEDGAIIVALTGPTDRYPHRALGDEIEASKIAVTSVEGSGTSTTEIVLDDRDVVEGISPMLTDLDGDGLSEIIVTVSNAEAGARLVVYDQAGSFVAESAPIGTGNRWRHQVAVGPTGPNGETEIVVIRTPHIGGIVEWFRLEGDRLELAATFEPGNGGINTTSHVLGSTNLDLAAVFDADGDGDLELVIPTQDRSSLAVVGRTSDGGELEQLVDVPGNVVTNLAVVTRTDGTIAVAVGTDENQIVTWASSP